MPNWSFNTIAIRGTKKQVINFLNEGLKRTHGRKKGFALLAENATAVEIEDKLRNYGLSLRSWLPMPRTFLRFDTTNKLPDFHWWVYDKLKRKVEFKDIESNIEMYKEKYADEYKKYCEGYEKAKEYQLHKYGYVGWYDYNRATLGTKWNSNIENWGIVSAADDCFILTAYCETAWNLPYAWVINMQKKHKDLFFACYAWEESYEYCGFMDGNSCDWVENHKYDEIEEKINKEHPELEKDSEDRWEYGSEYYGELQNEVYERFLAYIGQERDRVVEN